MPKCSKCGADAKRLSSHPVTKEALCVKCVQEVDFFPLDEGELHSEDERRAHVRIPLTIGMGFHIEEGHLVSDPPHKGNTVNLSIGGLCFAWDGCEECTGYLEGEVHEKCFFQPHNIRHQEPRKLTLQLQVTPQVPLVVTAFVVYTLKDEALGLEYVGARFAGLPNEQKQTLERIVLKYGGAG